MIFISKCIGAWEDSRYTDNLMLLSQAIFWELQPYIPAGSLHSLEEKGGNFTWDGVDLAEGQLTDV